MISTNTMLRLSTFCLLLAVAIAQNGYEYNKPGQPFGPGTSSRPGYPSSGYPTSTSAYPSGSQDEYPSNGAGTTPHPSGPSAGSNYPGQGPAGPSGSSGYQGQTGSKYPEQNYPGQGSSGSSGPSGYPGQSGPNYPGQSPAGQSGSSAYPGQPGSNYPGQAIGNPSTPTYGSGAPGFGSGAPGLGPVGPGFDTGSYEGGDYSAIPGEPGQDYPILSIVPETSFRCEAQRYPGYYADVETRCQAFHVCANNITYDFLCPNGTIFSQEVFVCVWWNQFDCNSAPSLYELNANLYDYSIIGSSGLPGSQGQGSYPSNQGPQGPSYSGSQGPQGSSYPGNQGPQGPSYASNQLSQGSAYPGSQGPQGPSYPVSQGLQGPSYPGANEQGPSTTYPDNYGNQGPSSGYPSSSYPQGTTPSYAGPNKYPGQQGPSTSYLESSKYPSSTGPQGNYPSSQGNYPGSQSTPGYPGSRPPTNQGYPSGRPSGPSFPTGTTRPQGPSTGYPKPPNREYLPPRN